VRYADVVKLFDSNRRLADLEIIDPNCSWAKWIKPREGNGEIRVANEAVIFAAPVLVVHYLEEHAYLPPAEFLKAVANAEIPNY